MDQSANPEVRAEDGGIAERITTTLGELPANRPISFFSLIHDLGFSAVDREVLTTAIHDLARDGRLLMRPSAMGDLELSSPMMSSRLRVGHSTTREAVMVFGRPFYETLDEQNSILAYHFCPPHPGQAARRRSNGSSFSGFHLHFGPDDRLVRIENVFEEHS